jgi:hypothetical protein
MVCSAPKAQRTQSATALGGVWIRHFFISQSAAPAENTRTAGPVLAIEFSLLTIRLQTAPQEFAKTDGLTLAFVAGECKALTISATSHIASQKSARA